MPNKRMDAGPHQFEEIGIRLRELRRSFGGRSQAEWAALHGFRATQYNNWERGERRIPLESSELLADRYGLTLDWIYRGREDGLSQTARNTLSSHRAKTRTT